MEISFTLREVSDENDWDGVLRDWRSQCDACDEPFDLFATSARQVIEDLIRNPIHNARALIIEREGNVAALCHANTALTKGYDEVVMRVRYLTLSPEYDFGEKTVDDYAEMLVGAVAGLLMVSDDHPTLQARHIKFHLRSPADRQFFAALGRGLNEHEKFEDVQLKGSWLHLTKAK